WAVFWGWHAKRPGWLVAYQDGQPEPGRNWLKVILLLVVCLCVTSLHGILVAGIKYPWQSVAALRRWHSPK
ncbi:MAG: hypothetical protein ONB49_19150, partial [candidate division KSB1 bacterium]|nr:hypothetical protein [candidate division KSB1 bacterium]